MSVMLIKVFNDKASLGKAAAEQAATAIRRAMAERDHARIIAATAASQLEFLDALTKTPGIDWQNVEAFHLRVHRVAGHASREFSQDVAGTTGPENRHHQVSLARRGCCKSGPSRARCQQTPGF